MMRPACLTFPIAILLFAAGCGNNSPSQNAEVVSEPTADELAALQQAVQAERRPEMQSALPANHPPINGIPQAPVDPSSLLPSGHPPIGNSPPAVRYEAPVEWEEQTPTSALRKAQFVLPKSASDESDAELVVYYFGVGQGGEVAANIDRWCGMFTEPDGGPLAADAGEVTKFDANGLPVTVLDISGRYAPSAMPGVEDKGPQENWRMIGAVVETPSGPWFFKATGPQATLEKHKDSILSMLKGAKQ